MFGFVVASLPTLSTEEQTRYRSLYCGLCHGLRDRYGQVSRAALTYDLTFYILLCNSLNEPQEHRYSARCPLHPTKILEVAQSPWTQRAADLTVALAYHKCLDDAHDEGSLKAKAAERLLAPAYERARRRIPDCCDAVESSMARIMALEARHCDDPDAAASEFGSLLGAIFGADQGPWQNAMEEFGYGLGRFIYLMDAAVDLTDDRESGSYNPFAPMAMEPAKLQVLLAEVMGEAVDRFERLPLEQDLHLMRNILYAGVWQQFNKTYEGKLPEGGLGPHTDHSETESEGAH